MNELVYILIIVGVFVVCGLGIWIIRKFKIKDSELELMHLVFDITKYIMSKTEIKCKDRIEDAVDYVLLAIDTIQNYNKMTDLEEKKELVQHTALLICKEEDVEIDDDFVALIDATIDYIVK